MIDYEVIVEYTDLITLHEETDTVGWAAENDLESEIEDVARMMGTRYNSMPRQRGKHRWEIREPGEFTLVVTARKIVQS